MYELIQVSDRSYYIQCPAKIGLVRLNDTDVCLIDSGNDKDAGRKVRQILDSNNWRLTAIYNTHSLCKEPTYFEMILSKLFTEYVLIINFEQYVLVGSTVRSYLAWLKDTGRVSAISENNMLLWKQI